MRSLKAPLLLFRDLSISQLTILRHPLNLTSFGGIMESHHLIFFVSAGYNQLPLANGSARNTSDCSSSSLKGFADC